MTSLHRSRSGRRARGVRCAILPSPRTPDPWSATFRESCGPCCPNQSSHRPAGGRAAAGCARRNRAFPWAQPAVRPSPSSATNPLLCFEMLRRPIISEVDFCLRPRSTHRRDSASRAACSSHTWSSRSKTACCAVQLHGLGATLNTQLHCMVEHQQPVVRVVIRAHRAAAALRQREFHLLPVEASPDIAVEDKPAGLHVNFPACRGLRRRSQRTILLFWRSAPGLPWPLGRSPEPLSASSA